MFWFFIQYLWKYILAHSSKSANKKESNRIYYTLFRMFKLGFNLKSIGKYKIIILFTNHAYVK